MKRQYRGNSATYSFQKNLGELRKLRRKRFLRRMNCEKFGIALHRFCFITLGLQTDLPLHNLTYQQLCGSQPWLNDTFRSKIKYRITILLFDRNFSVKIKYEERIEPGFVAGRTIGSPIWEKPPRRRAVERLGAFSEEERSVHSDSATSQNVVVSQNNNSRIFCSGRERRAVRVRPMALADILASVEDR
jgi:hypothetical protein